MKKINISNGIKPVSEFRANAANMIAQIKENKSILILTQRGHSAAVVMNVDEYEKIIDELELLRDIHIAEKQIVEGKTINHEKAFKMVMDSIKNEN